MKLSQHESVITNNDISVRFFKSETMQPGFVPLHWHQSIELIYVLSGEVTFTADSTHYTISADELFLIPSSMIHADTHTANSSFVIQIPLSFFKNLGLNPVAWQVNYDKLKTLNTQEIKHYFEELYRIYQSKGSGYIFSFYAILLILTKQLFINVLETYDGIPPIQDNRLTEVINYIHNHFTEHLSVAVLANQFGYNPNYLSRKFKKETGYTLVNYLYTLRIDRAYHQLISTRSPISHIFKSVGLPATQTTYTYFKQKYGCTPLQIRHRENNN